MYVLFAFLAFFLLEYFTFSFLSCFFFWKGIISFFLSFLWTLGWGGYILLPLR